MLELRDVHKYFGRGTKRELRALDGVTFSAEEGKITGLVGESGSGKSTIIRCIMGLDRVDSGEILFDGVPIQNERRSKRRARSKDIQLVFQDPTSSLNPRMTVGNLIAEGMVVHGLGTSETRKSRVGQLLERVGLSASDVERYPRSFSGGQRQRIAIARALAVEPRLLVCDEPVSSLDVSVQAQVLGLLLDMQRDLNLSLLFVAHNLAVVRQVCETVHVLNTGRIVESGLADEVLIEPQNEYTRSLIEAVPIPDPERARAQLLQRLAAKSAASGVPAAAS